MSRHVHPLAIPAIAENMLKRKWSTIILRHLKDGPKDVPTFVQREPDLRLTILNERLRTLIRYRLIDRGNRSGRPKVVDYRITPKGRRLLAILDLIYHLDQYADEDPRTLEQIIETELMEEWRENAAQRAAKNFLTVRNT